MKHLPAFIIALFLGSALAGPSLANEWSFFGGTPIPHGDSVGGVHGQKSGGWEAGLSYGVRLNARLTLYAEGCYHQLPNNVRYDWLSPMKVTDGSINLKIFTCDRHALKPYFMMGFGFAEINFLVDWGSTEITSSSFEPMIRAGCGLDYTLNKKWTLFGEAFAYESTNLSMIPVRLGIRVTL